MQGVPFSSGAPGASSTYPVLPGGGAQTGGAPPVPGSLYNPASTYGSGESNIAKQLIDIYGKGIGGGLDYLLQNMQGTDSAMLQQYFNSMQPYWAQERTQLGATLSPAGISGNSSVTGIAESNLAAQQNAQMSGFNSQLMMQQLQDTMGILQGTQPDAVKQVATTPLNIFGNVMSQIGQDVSAALGGGGFSLPSFGGGSVNYHGAPPPTGLG
jgi:hypothetical protein